MAAFRRLVSGLSVLDTWSGSACQADRNQIYEALFAVVDGSVFVVYDVLDARDAAERPAQFFVRVKNGLGARIRMDDAGGFGIVYIGAPDSNAGAAD
jgi:hypothetical protein